MTEPVNCRSCSKRIVYAVGPPTKNKPEGAIIPIDAEPQPIFWPPNTLDLPDPLPDGLSSRRTNVYELGEDHRGVTRASTIGLFYIVRDRSKVDPALVHTGLVSHFTTCPNAAAHSKAKS